MQCSAVLAALPVEGGAKVLDALIEAMIAYMVL
jgi:hypothetical protein